MGHLILGEPLGGRYLYAVVVVAIGILLVSLPRDMGEKSPTSLHPDPLPGPPLSRAINE